MKRRNKKLLDEVKPRFSVQTQKFLTRVAALYSEEAFARCVDLCIRGKEAYARELFRGRIQATEYKERVGGDALRWENYRTYLVTPSGKRIYEN